MRAIAIVTALVLASSISFASAKECHPLTTGDLPAASHTHKAALNRLKNRVDEPDQAETVRVPDILAYPHHEDLDLEKQGVTLEGYLLDFRPEGPESPNCRSATRVDYHIWIVANSRQGKARSIVVELTPNIQDKHPGWAEALSDLRHKNVCITGLLLYDWWHASATSNSRGTYWEVHPITGLAVRRQDGSCEPIPD